MAVSWLTSQLVQHEGSRVETESEAKWWNNPMGFNLLATNDPDYDPMFDAAATPPAGWQRLPMHEEVSSGE